MVDMKRLAAVTGAYTGYLIGRFEDLHHYVEEALGRPVAREEMAMPGFSSILQDASLDEFLRLWKEVLNAYSSESDGRPDIKWAFKEDR